MLLGDAKASAPASWVPNGGTHRPLTSSTLDVFVLPSSPMVGMRVRQLLRILRNPGCTELRQRGSHRIWRCGKCQTTVPGSDGETIPAGTSKSNRKHLAPCLGEGWREAHQP